MKIIYCNHSLYNPGGMERVLCNKVSYLNRNYDIELVIITTDQKGREPYYKIPENVRMIDLGINYSDDNVKSPLGKIAGYLKKRRLHQKRLTEVLLREKADIVISLYPSESSFIPKIMDGSKKILELHFNKFFRLQYGRTGILGTIDRWRMRQDEDIVKKFDAFVVLTEEDRGYWGNLKNIHVIGNAALKLTQTPEPTTDPASSSSSSTGKKNRILTSVVDRIHNSFKEVKSKGKNPKEDVKEDSKEESTEESNSKNIIESGKAKIKDTLEETLKKTVKNTIRSTLEKALDKIISPKARPKRVIAVGRLDYQKGFDRLIEAWKLVQDKGHKDWRLDIFGQGEWEDMLNEKIESYGIKENTKINPPTKNIAQEYLNSSILAMTSHYEGFPMVMIEAMALGVPVVTFDYKCGPRDIICDGINGKIVPNGEIEAFSETLISVMDDPKGLEKMSEEAKKVAERYSEESIMKKWIHLFETLLQKPLPKI